MIEIQVTKYALEPRVINCGTQGSEGMETLSFAFSAEWDGLIRSITFFPSRSTEQYYVIGSDGTFEIPAGVSAIGGDIDFVLTGSDGEKVLYSLRGVAHFDSTAEVTGEALAGNEYDFIKEMAKVVNNAAEEGAATAAAELEKLAELGRFDGEDGEDGEDGVSTFLAFSVNADGSGYTEKREDGQKYLGIARGIAKPPANTPGAYEWFKLEFEGIHVGEDEPTGDHEFWIDTGEGNKAVTAVSVKKTGSTATLTLTYSDGSFKSVNIYDGSEGASMAIRYSESEDGAAYTTTWSEGQKYIGIGAFNGTPPEDAAPALFTWVKFIGETGPQGEDYVLTDVDKTDIAENVIAILNDIPDYWEEHLAEKTDEICQTMETAGRNKSAFFFYSDAHWWQYSREEVDDWSKSYTVKREPALLKYLYKNTPINKTNFGGDSLGEEADISTAEGREIMAYTREWRKELRDLPSHHSVVGNHDDGNEVDDRYGEKWVYAHMLAAEETPDMVCGDGFYYYIDNPSEKTRYLYLDTGYKGLSSLGTAQTAFVKDALLSTPDGWHIVAISHIWHGYSYVDDVFTVGDPTAAASTLLAMFDSYNLREGDYTSCGGWVEFCIGGHTHTDYDSTSASGIPVILVEASSLNNRGGSEYAVGTVTETSLNAVIADYDAHEIHIIRIGRGENRDVVIENYIVNYTNVLRSAVDTDGSVYNGIGYKENIRISGSSGTSEKDNVDTTGFIPAVPGDVIRLKNITMNESSGTGSVCIGFYPALGITNLAIQGYSDFTSSTYLNHVLDDDGNVIQFTVPASSSYEGCAYIRITADDINADSIITVNETIE